MTPTGIFVDKQELSNVVAEYRFQQLGLKAGVDMGGDPAYEVFQLVQAYQLQDDGVGVYGLDLRSGEFYKFKKEEA